jgi:TatD DNase family protein
MGFYIGINGCGLKTDENLAMVATIPLDRIMLETGMFEFPLE